MSDEEEEIAVEIPEEEEPEEEEEIAVEIPEEEEAAAPEEEKYDDEEDVANDNQPGVVVAEPYILPDGWRTLLDPLTRRVLYVNDATERVQLQAPTTSLKDGALYKICLDDPDHACLGLLLSCHGTLPDLDVRSNDSTRVHVVSIPLNSIVAASDVLI